MVVAALGLVVSEAAGCAAGASAVEEAVFSVSASVVEAGADEVPSALAALSSVAAVASVLVVPSLPVAIVAVPVVAVVAAVVVAVFPSGQPDRQIANIETIARRIIIFPFCALNLLILSKDSCLFKVKVHEHCLC